MITDANAAVYHAAATWLGVRTVCISEKCKERFVYQDPTSNKWYWLPLCHARYALALMREHHPTKYRCYLRWLDGITPREVSARTLLREGLLGRNQ